MKRYVFAVVIALAVMQPAAAADKASPRASHRSTEQLPDFSGWWYLDLPADTTFFYYLGKAPLRPEIAEKMKALNPFQRRDATEEGITLKTLECAPVRFMGFNGGFEDDIELLVTPGRVTLTNESGLLRRIFTDGSSPDEMDQTNNGLSVGHWEGGTLVVKTHALNPNAQWGPRWPGAPTIGRNVRVSERISLRDANTLEIAMRMDAPALFSAPFATTFIYKRDKGHRFHEQSNCVDDDRSIDPVSGGQRFDLTPPANLPPPPEATSSRP
jgi:hypothetical protein